MDTLFNTLEIMKFTKIRKFELCKLAYSLKEKLLPEPLIELFNIYGKKTHCYSTRYKKLPNIKRHKSNEYNKSFLCKSLMYINKIDQKILNAKSKKEFVLNYKKYLFPKKLVPPQKKKTVSCNIIG